jgi:transketolase
VRATETWVEQCSKLATITRAHCLRMTHHGKSGHVGSMLSMAEILAVLYRRILRVDPVRTKWEERDRLILSKGHGGGALYAVLAEEGFFPKEWLMTYYCDEGKLMGHISHHVPGVEFSTGSLGHGLPVAVGMAIAGRYRRQKHRIFCILSDGDINEGSTWEAIFFAAQHHLDNLTVILDYNKIQALGFSKDILNLEPLTDKLALSHWSVREVNGHDVGDLEKALTAVPFQSGKPSWVTAHTIKGKGVSFLENTVACHYGSVNDEQLTLALQELGASDEKHI